MFMEEPATESETTTEEDMFGKPVLLGKGTYLPDDDLIRQLTDYFEHFLKTSLLSKLSIYERDQRVFID